MCVGGGGGSGGDLEEGGAGAEGLEGLADEGREVSGLGGDGGEVLLQPAVEPAVARLLQRVGLVHLACVCVVCVGFFLSLSLCV